MRSIQQLFKSKFYTSLLIVLVIVFLVCPVCKAKTWVGGSDIMNDLGVYGTKGTPDPNNVPGGRMESISWTDSSDNFWLFGGSCYDSVGSWGRQNSLWKFDGTNWTWVSGADISNQIGVYGTKGTPDTVNIPGARHLSIPWIDSSDDLWLFGGEGYDSIGGYGKLNDLWKFDGTNWTWVSGSNVIDQAGVYGTKGTANPDNIPGSRRSASMSWIDSNGNFWLFGSYGFDSAGFLGYLNDLWMFNGTDWTWISGSDIRSQPGVYGTKGTPDPANIPGSRGLSVSWKDSNGDVWMFGGTGYDSTTSAGRLNDMWMFDGTNWTWVSGSNLRDQPGVYGTKGTPDIANIPGARASSISWIDINDKFWLFSGYGYDSTTSAGRLNDMWMFDGTNWTWNSGSDIVNQWGVYGYKGESASAYIPSAREGCVSWTDSEENFWLLGGLGYDSQGNSGYLNDLWKFEYICYPQVIGDVNNDCRYDIIDFAISAEHWLEESPRHH